MTWLSATLTGALSIAAVSTLGDFVWATWITRHRAIFGLTHGALLFLAIGLFLGVLAGRRAAGALLGAAIGLVAAGSFYVAAPLAGYSVMFLAWVGAWIALGVLHAYLQRSGASFQATFARGIIAAIVCGAAFYAVSGIWLPFHPRGWDYLWHFGAWTIAFLPGFAALFVANRVGLKGSGVRNQESGRGQS